MIDIAHEIAAMEREVGRGQIAAGEGHAVRLRRTFDAPIEDVWDALANPERLSRWFLPISGDFRVGGRFQLEGNAGGEILACERPHLLRVTWLYGESSGDVAGSELEVRLVPGTEGATVLQLDHTSVVPDEQWAEYGPGAVGVGWDGGLLGLALHLRGSSVGDPIAWQRSAEGRAFATRSSEAWGEAYRASGADSEAVDRAVANTTAFYAPPRNVG
ncbi:MAG: SRPBCC domain-containing protein [Chloroflexi bacterium]|nr:SRPBCC domain-containing protein [Chloroflexota bacterium]